jgi:hypothetical protein
LIQKHHTNLEMIRSIAPELEVGTDVTLKIGISCPSACDLRGETVDVVTLDGVVTLALVSHHETMNETEECVLRTPADVGEHAWTIIFRRHETENVVHEEGSLPVSFRTIPHSTNMAVWDVPSPVATNVAFKAKVGVQCSASCQLTGQLIELRDETGAKIGEGRLGDTPWTGTSALYWTEVELTAPATDGVVFFRSAGFPAEGPGLSHEAASATFSFRTDKPAEQRVTVKVIDEKTEAPLEDVEVRFGLYMASTAEDGLVDVHVPKGTYDVSIRKEGYQAQPMNVEVTGDLRIQVVASRGLTRAEMEEKLMRFEDYPWG